MKADGTLWVYGMNMALLATEHRFHGIRPLKQWAASKLFPQDLHTAWRLRTTIRSGLGETIFAGNWERGLLARTLWQFLRARSPRSQWSRRTHPGLSSHPSATAQWQRGFLPPPLAVLFRCLWHPTYEILRTIELDKPLTVSFAVNTTVPALFFTVTLPVTLTVA